MVRSTPGGLARLPAGPPDPDDAGLAFDHLLRRLAANDVIVNEDAEVAAEHLGSLEGGQTRGWVAILPGTSPAARWVEATPRGWADPWLER